MNRRDFFRYAASAAVVLSVPSLLPRKQYWEEGVVLPLPYEPDLAVRLEDRQFAVEYLLGKVKEVFTAGTWYELRMSMPTDYGRTSGVAIYATADTPHEYLELKTQDVGDRYSPPHGVYILGRFQA